MSLEFILTTYTSLVVGQVMHTFLNVLVEPKCPVQGLHARVVVFVSWYTRLSQFTFKLGSDIWFGIFVKQEISNRAHQCTRGGFQVLGHVGALD
jgi:hypothetical protein